MAFSLSQGVFQLTNTLNDDFTDGNEQLKDLEGSICLPNSWRAMAFW